MEKKYIAIIASFFIGAFVYTLFHFWIRPISKYWSIKKKTIADLMDYLNSINDQDEGETLYGDLRTKVEAIRKHADALIDCYEELLPNWYKVLLNSRGESPVEASQHLIVLSNTHNFRHAQNRAEKIRQSLKK